MLDNDHGAPQRSKKVFTEAPPKANQAYEKRKTSLDLVELLDKIDALPISVHHKPLPSVRELAIRWWNTARHNGEWKNKDRVSLASDKDLLDRVTVIYIRDCYTEYKRLVKQLTGKPGQKTASMRLQSRVMESIAATYPELSDECERQASYRIVDYVDRIRCWSIEA